jgi:S1-C subfamily serine protease
VGATGPQGERGPSGAQGAIGPQGEAGDAGAEGADSSQPVAELAACISALRANLVGIQCSPDELQFSFGSGTITTAATVITAAHVVGDLNTEVCHVFDLDAGHATWLGQVVAQTPEAGGLDRTTLEVDWSVTPPPGIAPSSAPPALGELTASAGHPNALAAIQISTGYVTATGMLEFGSAWTNAFMTDYASSGGGSGGPVFDDACQWVGVHVGGFSNGLELSIALPF